MNTSGHKPDLRRYRKNLRAERDAARLYAAMAAAESNPALAGVYRRLEAVERRHLAFWESKLREAGAAVPPDRTGLRTRLLLFASRHFGNAAVSQSLAAIERNAGGGYETQPDAVAAGLAREERGHERIFGAIAGTGVPGAELARMEGRHKAAAGNALRAAVLGANDGLVSVFCLLMGVAGAGADQKTALVSGLAGLLAGAISMALGEWLSVQSSRELYGFQVETEREELENSPEEEQQELILIYQSKGVPEEDARRMVEHLFRDPRRALDTLVREELSFDPEELGGSAWEAAGTSFLLFAAGAAFPILPFVFWSGTTAVFASGAASLSALFLVGAAITLVTGRNAWFSGARQALIGAAAAGVTYGLGRWLGVSLS
jgi:VIT1/CCC1 family predicted Fe2+/Mn2+ transporter